MTFNLIKLHKLQYILTALVMLMGIQHIKAQIPSNDAAWVKNTSLSINFDSTALNSHWQMDTSTILEPNHVLDTSSNISFTGTSVKIKLDTLIPTHIYKVPNGSGGFTYDTCYFTGGLIKSNLSNYSFGYLEMYAKLPTGNTSYWPAFWTWMGSCSPSPGYYNEIDIMENFDSVAYYGTQMTNNIHLNSVGTCSNNIDNIDYITGLPNVGAAFHKYAVQWDANHMYFYFDSTLTRYIYDGTGASIPQNPMFVVFNFSQYPYGVPVHQKHGLPAYFEIQYFNYYTLSGGSSYCSSSTTICSPISYNRAVYNSITTGGSGCTTAPTFNPTTSAGSYTLRATNSVTIDAGTVINPSSSGYFAIEITPCP